MLCNLPFSNVHSFAALSRFRDVMSVRITYNVAFHVFIARLCTAIRVAFGLKRALENELLGDILM